MEGVALTFDAVLVHDVHLPVSAAMGILRVEGLGHEAACRYRTSTLECAQLPLKQTGVSGRVEQV